MAFAIKNHFPAFILCSIISIAYAQPGLVRVIAPNGGEIFHVGDTIRVRWETDTNLVPQVYVEISPDSGKTFFGMTARSVSLGSGAWGNVLWAIPDTFKGNISTQSTACIVQIYSYFDPGTNDLSDGFFAITPAEDEKSGYRCGARTGLASIPQIYQKGQDLGIKMPVDWNGRTAVRIITVSGKSIFSQNAGSNITMPTPAHGCYFAQISNASQALSLPLLVH